MAQVPQIWAIIILLSNSVDTRIDEWVNLMDWLKVIQRCFNCSETTVRQQSNMAWNRLVAVVRPHETTETLLSMLAKPITVQLERQATDKATKSSRAIAIASYCNLLYYSFRPAASHRQYTRVWNEYIVKVMRGPFFEKNAANTDIACRVLIALLWNSNKGTKVWNESRALQDSRSVEPEEIPTIDCKWVRAKSSGILDMFQILLQHSSWGASGQSDKAYIAVAWSHFLKALREASSKEIKQSSETKHATITIIKFLERLWDEAAHGPDDIEQHTLAQIRQMTRSAVVELGNISMLMALEGSEKPIRMPFMFSEILSSILADMIRDSTSTTLRPYPSSHRSPLKSLMPQYEKCLDLMGDSIIQEYQSENRLRTLCEAMTILSTLLLESPPELLFATVSRLSTALALLLKDERNILVAQVDHADEQAYKDFSINTITVLMKTSCTAVELLDEVFTAAFEARSPSVVEHAITMWNATFGHQETTTLGPELKAILLKFRTLTDVQIPGMPESTNTQDILKISSPLSYQEMPSPASPHSDISEGFTSDNPGIPSPILGSQAPQRIVIAEEGCVEDVLSRSAVAKASRARHNDSQLHFVPIESSPHSDEGIESQFLTTHQKDVRDRQRSEPAVVFADLRSSPRPQSKSQTYGDCEFARKAAALMQRPSTPTLPTNQDQTELEIMASPTPRARHFTTRIADIEVPSSPPSMHDNQEREVTRLENLSSPPQEPVDDAQMGIEIGIPPSDQLDHINNEMDNHLEPTEEAHHVIDEPLQEINEHVVQTSELDDHQSITEMQTIEMEFATASEGEFQVSNAERNEQTCALSERTDSDDIDMLSASQLSQDLDRHLNQTSETPTDPQQMELTDPEASEEMTRESSTTRSQNTRKRKASHFSKPAKKKRTKSSSQQSSDSIQATSQQELLDTIEVLSSPRFQPADEASSVQDQHAAMVAPTPTPKRARARRRKHSRAGESQNSGQPAQLLEAVIVPLPSAIKNESHDANNAGVDNDIEEHPEQRELIVLDDEEVANDQEHYPIESAVDATTPHQMAQATTDEGQETEDAQPAYLKALEMALDCLKNKGPKEIDLRAVDELCFQIRYHAQQQGQQLRNMG